ncbi:MAG: cyclase family protein [Clostridia bacterium]|nr:cyclase family protein [Clostridia bacterium]
MKYYDITQEVFSCRVYPGDPAPKREVLSSMAAGDLYDLTAFSMCAHNGTHIDAPRHFIKDGKTVDALSLEHTVGLCYVASFEGLVTEKDAKTILEKAGSVKRILIKGNATLTYEGAEVFRDAGILLFGNESQTVGPEDAPMAVHKLLLSADVVLLEGVRLAGVHDGVYFLFAAPLLLGGAEGAPCRAVLISQNEEG